MIAYSGAAAFPTVSRTFRLSHERDELVSLLGVCSHLFLIWSVAKACAAASLNLQKEWAGSATHNLQLISSTSKQCALPFAPRASCENTTIRHLLMQADGIFRTIIWLEHERRAHPSHWFCDVAGAFYAATTLNVQKERTGAQ